MPISIGLIEKITLIVFLFFSGCIRGNKTTAEETEEIMLKISSYKIPCIGEGVRLCFLTSESGSNSVTFFYDRIEGFEYEWGYNYEILVYRQPVKDPPADASAFRYTLKKVLEKKKESADRSFEIPLKAEDYLAIVNQAGNCSLLHEIKINTAKYSCEELSNASFATFLFGEKELIPINLK